MFKRNEKREEKASSTLRARIDVPIDPNNLDSIQYMIHREVLMTLKPIHEILSSMAIVSKSHTDIESGKHHYRISCRMAATMLETTDNEIDASISLTTSAGSIEDFSSELVKLVQDIETILDKG